LWADAPRDEDDRPLWNAAVRAGANIVFTENLKDGPPVASNGLRVWDNVFYLHPRNIGVVIEWWRHLLETGEYPAIGDLIAASTERGEAAAGSADIPIAFHDILRALLSDGGSPEP